MTHLIISADAPIERRKLPPPQIEGGMPLMTALHRRCSLRKFSGRPIDDAMLSSLLWAAFGINRPMLEPADWTIRLITGEDIRAATGLQDYVKTAPLALVYVSRLSRLDETDKPLRQFYTSLDTGYISQNVYLFCAAFGLATVARGLLDRRTLAKAMHLDADQRVIIAQSVGFPG